MHGSQHDSFCCVVSACASIHCMGPRSSPSTSKQLLTYVKRLLGWAGRQIPRRNANNKLVELANTALNVTNSVQVDQAEYC